MTEKSEERNDDVNTIVNLTRELIKNPQTKTSDFLGDVHEKTSGRYGLPKKKAERAIQEYELSSSQEPTYAESLGLGYLPSAAQAILNWWGGELLSNITTDEAGYTSEQTKTLKHLRKLNRLSNLEIVETSNIPKGAYSGDSEVGHATQDFKQVNLKANYTPRNPPEEHPLHKGVVGDLADYLGYKRTFQISNMFEGLHGKQARKHGYITPEYIYDRSGNSVHVKYCDTRRALRDWVSLVTLYVIIDEEGENQK